MPYMNYNSQRKDREEKKKKATKLEGSFLSEPNFHLKILHSFIEDYKCNLNRQSSYVMIEMRAVILNIN